MKRSRFTEEQIIAMLREQEAGMSTANLCREHGVSSATFYSYRAQRGTFEAESGKLKRLLADAMLDNAILKDVAAQKC